MFRSHVEDALTFVVPQREVVLLLLVHLLDECCIIAHQGIKDWQISIVVCYVGSWFNRLIYVALWLSCHANNVFNSLTLVVLITSGFEVVRLTSAIHHVEPVKYLSLACSSSIE